MIIGVEQSLRRLAIEWLCIKQCAIQVEDDSGRWGFQETAHRLLKKLIGKGFNDLVWNHTLFGIDEFGCILSETGEIEQGDLVNGYFLAVFDDDAGQ